METKLKPFDLEAAKAGAKVVTRGGQPVRIICTDKKMAMYPIVVLVEKYTCGEEIEVYDTEGRCSHHESQSDLVMALVKRKGWVNLYREGCRVRSSETGVIYTSREDAVAGIAPDREYVATAFAVWEE